MNFATFLEQKSNSNFDFTQYIVEVVDDNDDYKSHSELHSQYNIRKEESIANLTKEFKKYGFKVTHQVVKNSSSVYPNEYLESGYINTSILGTPVNLKVDGLIGASKRELSLEFKQKPTSELAAKIKSKLADEFGSGRGKPVLRDDSISFGIYFDEITDQDKGIKYITKVCKALQLLSAKDSKNISKSKTNEVSTAWTKLFKKLGLDTTVELENGKLTATNSTSLNYKSESNTIYGIRVTDKQDSIEIVCYKNGVNKEGEPAAKIREKETNGLDAVQPSSEGRFGFTIKLSNIDDAITEHKKYIKAIDNIFKKVLKL